MGKGEGNNSPNACALNLWLQLVNLLFFKSSGIFEKNDISTTDGGTKNQGHRLEDGTEGERRGVVSLGVQEQKQVNSFLASLSNYN